MKYFLNFFSVIIIKNMDIKKSTKGILFPDIINEQHIKQKENRKTEGKTERKKDRKNERKTEQTNKHNN